MDVGSAVAGDSRLVVALDRLMAEACRSDLVAVLDDVSLRERVRLARRMEGAAAIVTARATAELQHRGELARDGAPTASAWLEANTGRSGRDASRVARLASTLDALPATAAALAEGRLGVEAADSIARAARDADLGTPEQVEATLLPVATTSPPERLRAEIRHRTQQADPDALLRDERRQHARRRLSLTSRDDGMWDLHGLLAGEAGNRVRTLLDAYDHPDPSGAPPGARRRPDQRLADALDIAATSALDHLEVPATGGVNRPHVAVVVDLATFDADLTDPTSGDRPVAPDDPAWRKLSGGRTAWAGTLSPQATRRICCDAGVSRVVTAGDSQVLDVGRSTRTWSPAQRRAVNVRDRGCRGPACDRPVGWTQIHHLRWWRHGGRTDVGNGVALCHACHRLVHDRGWQAELDPTTAAVTWTSPDRRRTIVSHPRPPT